MDISNILTSIEAAVGELPEAAGQALKYIGEEIARLGTALEALAARMEKD